MIALVELSFVDAVFGKTVINLIKNWSKYPMTLSKGKVVPLSSPLQLSQTMYEVIPSMQHNHKRMSYSGRDIGAILCRCRKGFLQTGNATNRYSSISTTLSASHHFSRRWRSLGQCEMDTSKEQRKQNILPSWIRQMLIWYTHHSIMQGHDSVS